MIDDFKVPNDPGYIYDNYGPERALTETILPEEPLRGWTVFYPAVPSNEETGARRGSCVLISPLLAPKIDTPHLRAHRVL